MSQTYGTLVVGHFAKLLSPRRLHQFAKSTSPNCQLHVTKVTILIYYPSYLGGFRILSVIFGQFNNNNNNNVQFSITLKTKVIVLETLI